MTTAPGPDLVVIGNLLVDDMVFADGRTRMGEAGGAILHAALAASLWNVRVGVVSVAGDDYPATVLAALETRGVDLSGIRRLSGPGLRTWLVYESARRRVVHQLERPSHEAVSPRPEDIPAAFASAKGFHLSPMPIASQNTLIQDLTGRPGAFLSVDPHEPVREDTLEAWRDLLGRVDAFLPSDDEFLLAGAALDPRAALRRLGAGRLKLVACKRGARGGLLYERERDRFTEWSAIEGPTVDRTGAGDAFAGGFLAAFLSGGSVERALQQGAVSASFAVEGWGARGLMAATPERAEGRREACFGAKAGS